MFTAISVVVEKGPSQHTPDPHEGEPCTVHIRRNSDGEVRQHADKWFGDFIWSEGNYACDCNRHLFFAGGAEDHVCGYDAYAIPKIELADGTVVYSED